MTPSGIEPSTFRFVAQHLNHCATAVPFTLGTVHKIIARIETAAAKFEYRSLHPFNGQLQPTLTEK